jgi:two-component system CheB/CheR fusion protein
MANDERLPHLIVIGSSAGGIDALSVLVATLPADFSAPIVVAQHLDPSRPSHLDEILARQTKMAVRMMVDGSQPLQQGSIYVVPSNRNVRIDDAHITISVDGTGRVKPSVDLLMTSASESYGERLIAIILSGTGSDGAAGARAVKRAGGTVIIQNPETAPFPGMPLSLAPSIVDITADVDRIGPILRDLLAGIAVPTQPKERRALEDFLEDVRTRLDIDFKSYKLPTIMRRLQRRIVATETGDLGGYIDYLAAHPEEYQQLANAFLIKVTDFFRDPDLFEYLRINVLPELIEYGRTHGNDVRIWSAGCATGEEAYSLAILVAELLGPALEQFNVRIFATDIDAEAVAFARRGIYPAAALSTMPPELVDRYFTKEDDNYQIRKRVRSLTVFGQHDLAQRAPFPRVDLVVCRNVLIYFTNELQQRTLQLFAYALRDGGFLALGKAESPGTLVDVFAPADRAQKVYRRHGDRFLMPPARMRPAAPPVAPHRLGYARHASERVVPQMLDKAVSRARVLPENFVMRLPVGIVVVNRQYDIQTINGPARQYFGIHSPAIGDDLIHLAQGIPHASLRTAIDAAFRTGAQQAIDEFAVEAVATGKLRYLQVLCYPQRPSGDQAPVDAVLIAAHDITRFVESRQQLEQQVATTSGEIRQLRQDAQAELAARDQMVERLVETNRQLLEANQDLTSANEEMRTTNEELLLAAEEAQASTEEVETLNEELQATNEELETLNEELQATIEELNTTNDDLHARSVELQTLARTSEEERAQLGVILASMADAVVVVGNQGQPLVTNAAYDQMVGEPASFVPLDESGALLPPEQTPLQRAARGEVFSMEFVVAAPDGARRWYEANGQPVRNHESSVQAVVVIRDTTERSLRRLQDEFIARAGHELRTPLTPIQTYLQQLLRHLPQSKETEGTRGYAESALAQTKRLARLVKDMVEATRLQTGKYSLDPRPMRLDELLAATVDVARLLGGKQTINLAISGAPITINGDADRLEQVVLNLLTNAIKYAPNTERIDVRLRHANPQAELSVQDYGPGIPPAAAANIFHRYYQVERPRDAPLQGLGLGLYISKEIVTAHGGTLTVESQPGKGTTFTVRLPLLDEKSAGKGKR